MHELRMLSAWKTMELNSCLRRLVSFQRTQLLSILEARECRPGEELWKKKEVGGVFLLLYFMYLTLDVF
jgi:hypothetical protein